MPTPQQTLKALGHLRDVGVSNLSGAEFLEGSDIHNCWCGCPNHGDKEIAGSDPEVLSEYLDLDVEHCIHLAEMHRRLLDMEQVAMEQVAIEQVAIEPSSGRGSWPFACHEEWPQNHSASYYLDYDSFPSQYTRKVKDSELDRLMTVPVWGSRKELFSRYSGRPMLDVAFSLVRRAYYLRNIALFRVDKKSDANIVVAAKPIRGSVIGYAYYNNGTCGDQVILMIDSTYSPPLSPCAMVIGHEFGHTVNLKHTKAYATTVMSYKPRYPWVGFSQGNGIYDRIKDVSIPVLEKYFGRGVIVDPRTPSGPVFPDASDWPKAGGEILIGISEQTGRRIIRGTPTITVDGKAWPYIVKSIGGDRFILEPNILQRD